jgi:hypothetical protein
MLGLCLEAAARMNSDSKDDDNDGIDIAGLTLLFQKAQLEKPVAGQNIEKLVKAWLSGGSPSSSPPPLLSLQPLQRVLDVQVTVAPVPVGQARVGNDCWAISLALLMMSLPLLLELINAMVALADEYECPVIRAFSQMCISHGKVSGAEFSQLVETFIITLNISAILYGEQHDSMEIFSTVVTRINNEAYDACMNDESTTRTTLTGNILQLLAHLKFDTLIASTISSCLCGKCEQIHLIEGHSALFSSVSSTTALRMTPGAFSNPIGVGKLETISNALNCELNNISSYPCTVVGCTGQREKHDVTTMTSFPTLLFVRNQLQELDTLDGALDNLNRQYTLVGVLKKTGDMRGGGGHYYVITKRKGVFFIVDDDRVTKIDDNLTPLDTLRDIAKLEGTSVVYVYELVSIADPVGDDGVEIIETTTPPADAGPPLLVSFLLSPPEVAKVITAAISQVEISALKRLQPVEGCPGGLTHEDLVNLMTPYSWLTGEHISEWARRINREVLGRDSEHPLLRVYSSYFYTALRMGPDGYEYKRGSPRADRGPFQYKSLALPINIMCGNPLLRGTNTFRCNHWAVLYIDLQSRVIYYLDTMTFRKNSAGKWVRNVSEDDAKKVANFGLRWLKDVHDDYFQTPLIGEWELRSTPTTFPRQIDGSSCGLYVAGLLQFLSFGVIPTSDNLTVFSVEKSLEWRARMVVKLVVPVVTKGGGGGDGVRVGDISGRGKDVVSAPRAAKKRSAREARIAASDEIASSGRGAAASRGGMSGSGSGEKRARTSNVEKVSEGEDDKEVGGSGKAVERGGGGGGVDSDSVGFGNNPPKPPARKRRITLTPAEAKAARAAFKLKINTAIDTVAAAKANFIKEKDEEKDKGKGKDPVASFKKVSMVQLQIFLRYCRNASMTYSASTTGNKSALIDRVLNLADDITLSRVQDSDSEDGEGGDNDASEEDDDL